EALTIPANTTKSYYLSANMPATLDAYAGQVAALSLVSVGTTATISGVLPITGNGQTINATLAIGSAAITVGSLDPISASASKEVGTTNFNFAALKVTAGSAEDVTAYSIKWNQSGSAAASDLTNIVVSDGTTSYVATVSSDGKYYTASFGTAGLVIAKGLSKEFTVKGDIANGSARTVGFDIYKDTDIVIKGNNYGYYMTPTFTDNGITHSDAGATAIEAASSPYFAGANVTISSGSLRLDKSSSGAPAANITKGSQGVLLGAFDFVVKGEPVNITSMELAITVSAVAASSSDLTNITLTKADGAILAGPVNAVDTSTSNNDGTATFSGTVTFPVGTTQVLVKGNLNTDPAADATYIVSFTPATKITNITGQTTGNSITATPASQVSANTMTVKAGALTVRVSSTPSAQSVVKGTTGYTFSNFVFDTSASGEDVRVTSMTVRHGAYTASKQSDITALTMYDGSQILNATALTGVEAAATSTETYTFDTALVIPKGGQKVVALKGNISGVATATGHEFGLLNGTTAIAATGVSTGQDIEETVTTGSGQKMTIVDSGQYSVSLDSGSPTKTASKMLVANTTGNIITTLRFRATSEAITINKIGLYLSNASSSAKDIAKVWVYDEGGNLLAWSDSPFNGATAGDDGTTSGFSVSPGLQAGTVALVLQADEEKVVTIKADVAEIKASASTDAVAGHSVAINYYGSTSTTYNYGTGSSGTINNYSAATAANPFYIYRSIPTVVETTPTTSFSAGAGAGSTLDTVAVTADPKGAIDLYKLTFYVSTSSNVALTNIKLYEGSNVLYASSTNWYIDPMGHYIDIVLRQNPGTTAAAVPYTIGAGLTKTFVLKGDLSYSGDNTSFTASAYLAGDGAETGKASGTYGLTATNADADTNNDFIWSDWSDVDHSSSATGASTADWYNGYLMNVPSSTY
ncbi:MAG: hypothetical protein COT26_02215, partial [Candidatus Kerfeldbacteria bacterium CG08_land_8_20_14_0_20_43_14]